jgi:predicted ABC-class ATPase
MQELVSKEREPITPFIDRVDKLHRDRGVSTVLVLGGSGDYFDVADRVLCMVNYAPEDVTSRAKAVAARHATQRRREGGEALEPSRPRIPLAESFDPSKGRRDTKISPRGLHTIAFGRYTIDLQCVEQLVDPSQTRAIGDAIQYATQFMDGRRTLRQIVESVLKRIHQEELDALSHHPLGDYAEFRGIKLAAAINRLRSLSIMGA